VKRLERNIPLALHETSRDAFDEFLDRTLSSNSVTQYWLHFNDEAVSAVHYKEVFWGQGNVRAVVEQCAY